MVSRYYRLNINRSPLKGGAIMNELLKAIPTTLEGIYNNVEHGKFLFEGKVKRTFNDIEDIYKYLDTPDKLTDELYGEYKNWKYTFPFATNITPNPGVARFRGYLGSQYCKWHYESVKHHAAIVTENLLQAGELPRCAAILGVAHDCGKKYTCATNKRGELCFYDHNIASAYFGLWWAWRFLAEEERKVFLAVVYGHDFPWQQKWKENPEAKEAYEKELQGFIGEESKRAIALIEKLAECDKGCENEDYMKDPNVHETIIRGLKTIEMF